MVVWGAVKVEEAIWNKPNWNTSRAPSFNISC
jgi:hypothetical protein